MIELKCPSCNGSLELPDDMEVAHCLYCGTKILLNEYNKPSNIKQYIELLKAALSAENYKEAFEYCNKVLEVDSKNVDAWIDKAISMSHLTTVADDKFDEALSYLKKAYSISPGDTRLKDTARKILQTRASWENHLTMNKFRQGIDIFNQLNRTHIPRLNLFSIASSVASKAININNAKNTSRPYFQSAMFHFMRSRHYYPYDKTVLENISFCAKSVDWFNWSFFQEPKEFDIEEFFMQQEELADTQPNKVTRA